MYKIFYLLNYIVLEFRVQSSYVSQNQKNRGQNKDRIPWLFSCYWEWHIVDRLFRTGTLISFSTKLLFDLRNIAGKIFFAKIRKILFFYLRIIFQNNFKLIVNDYNIIWDQIGGSDHVISTVLTVFGSKNCQLWTPITPDPDAVCRKGKLF